MKNKAKKLNVVGAVVTVVLLLFVVAMFVINMLFYKDTAAPSFFGKYYVYITGDEQKIEGIEKNIAVICDSTYMNNVQVGNVVLAEVNDEKDYAVLRIVGMDETTYTLKSDYSEIDDTITLPKSDAVALCYSKSAGFGGFVDFATTNAGVVILIILPLTIIIVMKAWSILGKENDGEQKSEKNSDVSEKKKKEKKAKEDAKRKKADAEKSEPVQEQENEPETEPEYETETEIESGQQEESAEEEIIADETDYTESSDSDEDNVYLIKKDENGDTAIISADDEDEDEEPDVDITQYMNPSEEPQQTEEDYEPVISVSENNDSLVSEPESPEADEIIYRNDIPSELPDIISDDVKPSEPVVKTVEKAEAEPVKTAVKKPSAHKKNNNRYTANKYATGARRSNSRTSVDDLLKTIDSEKSKIHK